MYNVLMSVIWKRTYHCDVCGHDWLPESDKLTTQCPSRKCRSAKWNKDVAVQNPLPTHLEQPPPTRAQTIAKAIPSVVPASSLPTTRDTGKACSQCGSLNGMHQRWCK